MSSSADSDRRVSLADLPGPIVARVARLAMSADRDAGRGDGGYIGLAPVASSLSPATLVEDAPAALVEELRDRFGMVAGVFGEKVRIFAAGSAVARHYVRPRGRATPAFEAGDLDLWTSPGHVSRVADVLTRKLGYGVLEARRITSDQRYAGRLSKFVSRILSFARFDEGGRLQVVQVMVAAPEKSPLDAVRTFDVAALAFAMSLGRGRVSPMHPEASDDAAAGVARVSEAAFRHQVGWWEWARTAQRLAKYARRGMALDVPTVRLLLERLDSDNAPPPAKARDRVRREVTRLTSSGARAVLRAAVEAPPATRPAAIEKAFRKVAGTSPVATVGSELVDRRRFGVDSVRFDPASRTFAVRPEGRDAIATTLASSEVARLLDPVDFRVPPVGLVVDARAARLVRLDAPESATEPGSLAAAINAFFSWEEGPGASEVRAEFRRLASDPDLNKGYEGRLRKYLGGDIFSSLTASDPVPPALLRGVKFLCDRAGPNAGELADLSVQGAVLAVARGDSLYVLARRPRTLERLRAALAALAGFARSPLRSPDENTAFAAFKGRGVRVVLSSYHHVPAGRFARVLHPSDRTPVAPGSVVPAQPVTLYDGLLADPDVVVAALVAHLTWHDETAFFFRAEP